MELTVLHAQVSQFLAKAAEHVFMSIEINKCREHSNQSMVCRCDDGYTGSECERKINNSSYIYSLLVCTSQL